jgi:hypothetical protein
MNAEPPRPARSTLRARMSWPAAALVIAALSIAGWGLIGLISHWLWP